MMPTWQLMPGFGCWFSRPVGSTRVARAGMAITLDAPR